LNPDSLVTLAGCHLEASLRDAAPGARYQFERLGYFCVDTRDSQPGKTVLNRIVPLRDSWAKIAGSGK
jgi:glutaminyl-tRNA synthetase